MKIEQRIFDWTTKHMEWNGDSYVGKRGPVGWIAKRLHDWIWHHCDVIPF